MPKLSDYFFQTDTRYHSIQERVESIISYVEGQQCEEYHPAKNEQHQIFHTNTDLFSTILIHDSNGTNYTVDKTEFKKYIFDLPLEGLYHRHDYIEILYVLNNSFEQILLGDHHIFNAGELIITDQNCNHADYLTERSGNVLTIGIRASYLDSILNHYNGSDELFQFLFRALRKQKSEQRFLHFKPEKDNREMDFLFEQLIYEEYTGLPGRDEITRGLLLRLFYLLCQDYELQSYSNQVNREAVTLYEVERYISNHLETVTIAELESRFHYHRNYYNHLLKKYEDMSFKEYVHFLRMKKAAKLLISTDLPVRTVSEQVGYNNSSFFYKVFKKQFNQSPADYRKSISLTKCTFNNLK